MVVLLSRDGQSLITAVHIRDTTCPVPSQVKCNLFVANSQSYRTIPFRILHIFSYQNQRDYFCSSRATDTFESVGEYFSVSEFAVGKIRVETKLPFLLKSKNGVNFREN